MSAPARHPGSAASTLAHPQPATARDPRPLRVALVIASLGAGGAERVACALTRRWDEAGHHVALLTIASRSADVHPVAPRVRRIALDLVRPSRNVAEGMFQACRRALALRHALVDERPDVVVSFLHRTNVLLLFAMLGSDVPMFVCERTDPRYDDIGRWWDTLRRLLYPRAAGVVVQTESVAAWARAFCPRVHVIPNFVEAPSFTAEPAIDHGPRELIAMGRLSHVKGFDLLIEAFARVADAHRDWSLTILGDGPERERLEALAGAAGVAGRVSLPGRVADPGPYLRAAHAFALSSRREGFPNALLEAMACGLPAIAFDCPSGPADIIVHEQNGLLVRAGDVSEFARALARVMGSAEERERLGRNAREIAVRLAPEPILARWSALLRVAEVH